MSALSNGIQRFIFEGREIKLEWSCGIFITMNPGYAGRTELPDNLKSMFRPISMVVPDSTLIAEIILFGEGFNNTKVFCVFLPANICIWLSLVSVFSLVNACICVLSSVISCQIDAVAWKKKIKNYIDAYVQFVQWTYHAFIILDLKAERFAFELYNIAMFSVVQQTRTKPWNVQSSILWASLKPA